ncbi:hypothetical protein, partial [Neobacillus niacini]|uniref:hypothetical protein n=1 Tax=Neobacillus niacini TaxID=86668 RepID=UPI003000B780
MVDYRNEQGYALVSVLLIVVVFSVLSLSFMGQAFSSVKQNQEVEKNTQSVAISEMGVSYYQVAIQNLFEQKKDEVALKVKNKIYKPGDESQVLEFLRSSLETGIKNIPDPPNVEDEASFKLDKG